MKLPVLLYDAACASCSEVAARAQSVIGDRVEVRSLKDSEVATMVKTDGLVLPDEPAVLVRSGNRLLVRTGLGMRLTIARLVGLRRAG